MSWFTGLTIRQKELLTGFSILFLIVGSFLSAEVILRVKQILEFGSVGTVEKMPAFYRDKKTGLRLPVPNAKMGKITFNSLGYRGPELGTVKKSDVIRIAYLGSSIVFDPYTSNEEKTWSGVTTAGLQKKFPDCKFEYFNAGIPGMNTKRLIKYYENFIKQSEPNLVLIMTDYRSQQLDAIAKETGIHDGVHYRPTWLAQKSLFWGKLEMNAVIQKRIRTVTNNKNKIVYTKEQLLQNYKKYIRELINDVKNDSSIPVLLSLGQKIRAEHSLAEKLSAVDTAIFFLPYMRLNDFIKTLDIYNEENGRVANESNIPYIQWHNELEGNDENFIDSTHFTSKGSIQLGGILSEKLAQNSLLLEQLVAKGFSCVETQQITVTKPIFP